MLAGYPIKQAASGVFGHDEKQESTFVTGVEPLQKREMSNLSTQKYCSRLWCFLLKPEGRISNIRTQRDSGIKQSSNYFIWIYLVA